MAKRAEEHEEYTNVIDWRGSSMLKLITLSQNYRLARRSTQVDQLELSDIPHLEESVRMAGVEPGEIVKPGERVTGWAVLQSVWWPRKGTLLICECA